MIYIKISSVAPVLHYRYNQWKKISSTYSGKIIIRQYPDSESTSPEYIPTLYCEFVEQKNIHTFLSCLTLPETTPRNSYTGDEISSHFNTVVVLWPMYIAIVFNSQFSTRKKSTKQNKNHILDGVMVSVFTSIVVNHIEGSSQRLYNWYLLYFC